MIVVGVTAFAVLTTAFTQDTLDVTWHASSTADREGQTRTVELGDATELVNLNGGWSCEVSTTSKQRPQHATRLVACTKGSDVVEFSVQCELGARPRDDTLIRFRDANGELLDFIDVGCELAEHD